MRKAKPAREEIRAGPVFPARGRKRAPEATYVDGLMNEWQMDEKPRRLQACVRKVLGELSCEALLFLKHPSFEVLVLLEAEHAAWAYFPFSAKRLIGYELKHRKRVWTTEATRRSYLRNPSSHIPIWRRLIAQQAQPKRQTRVLLVLSATDFTKEPVRKLEGYLRDHLGHVLLYLRSPMARNDCQDAYREWLWHRKAAHRP
jgi:hypothetical protein